MVDMFFYRDPEEVEKQQQEEAQAKLAAQQGVEEAPVSEWDVTQGGNINPALASEGGESPFISLPFVILISTRFQALSTGLRTLNLATPIGLPSPLLEAGVQSLLLPLVPADGIKFMYLISSLSCLTIDWPGFLR